MKRKYRVKNYARLLEFMEKNGIADERINFVFSCFAFGRRNKKTVSLLHNALNSQK